MNRQVSAARSISRRDTGLSSDSKYDSADETFQDEDTENRRRPSTIGKLIRQASNASMSVYNGARKVLGGTYNDRRRRSSVRRKHGVDRPLIELVRERILELIEVEEKKFQAKKGNMSNKDCNNRKLSNNNLKEAGAFHPKDLLYIRETDDMIIRFLFEYFEDHPYDDSKCEEETIANNVAPQIIETLKWRHETRINELKDSDFPREFYECGLYTQGEDSDGNPVVYVKGSKCRKTPASWTPILISFLLHESDKKLIDFFGDPMNPKNPTARPGIICDCSNVSITNIDINLAFALLPLTKHYPQAFGYVWSYEVPWLVKPFFNLILKVLPGRIVRKVRIMDKKTAFDEMGEEGIPRFMGGKSPLEPFMLVPETASTLIEVGKKNGISDDDTKKMIAVMKQIKDA